MCEEWREEGEVESVCVRKCVYLGVGVFLGGERGTRSSWLTPRKSSFMEKPERGGLVAIVISSPRTASLVACTHSHNSTQLSTASNC